MMRLAANSSEIAGAIQRGLLMRGLRNEPADL